MSARAAAAPRRDWLAKTLAGALLGFALALGCSAVFAQLAAGLPLPIRAQLAMWLLAPVWLSAWGAVYFFADGRRAWLGLGAANAAVLAGWALLRAAGH